MPSVKIGPSFFVNELREYVEWEWGYVREAMQNSIDATGCDQINVLIEAVDGNTRIMWENNGEPMSEDILINKLMAIGESGKCFAGSVGGFGKAKTLLYFAHESYEVRTGTLEMRGSGSEYSLEHRPYFHGTKSVVVMRGDKVSALLQNFKKFAFWAQWRGTLTVNGEQLETSHHKGSPRRDLGFGQVYTNRTTQYKLCVRIGGIPMFVQSIGLDRCVIVELKGQSNQVLTANRDGLTNPYRNQLADFVTELAVDKRSALKNRSRGPRYREYRGTKLCHRHALDVVRLVGPSDPVVRSAAVFAAGGSTAVEDGGSAAGIDVIDGDNVQDPLYHEDVQPDRPMQAAAGAVSAPLESCQRVVTLGHSFILKNETDLKVPACYDPGSGEFSSYSTKLARYWGRIMMELHRLFDVEAEFSIGFIFDDSTAAEHEDGNYGKVYYLNPCKVVEQSCSSSKSFKKRWQLTDHHELVMAGLHEMVHGCGYSWHDERYAGKLTDMAAKVFKNWKRFTWCFK